MQEGKSWGRSLGGRQQSRGETMVARTEERRDPNGTERCFGGRTRRVTKIHTAGLQFRQGTQT